MAILSKARGDAQKTFAGDKNLCDKTGQRRPEPAKRSWLRKIRLKIGGKVADIFTW